MQSIRPLRKYLRASVPYNSAQVDMVQLMEPWARIWQTVTSLHTTAIYRRLFSVVLRTYYIVNSYV